MPRPCRVLVVEDSDDVGELLKVALTARGYEVALVATGPDAIEKLTLDDFDLVVVDMTLPRGKNGTEVARAAAAEGAGVVLISGNPAAVPQGEASGFAFLQKPFRLGELQSLAARILEEKGADCAIPEPGETALPA